MIPSRKPEAHFCGMPIFISHILPTTAPVKELPLKKWHSHKRNGKYAARVNKKWLKKFGVKKITAMYRTKDAIIMSPVAFLQFKAEIERTTSLVPERSGALVGKLW